ncbi:MAG: EVE domain-containing protein [Bacteroidota bacterium]|nr:EVE domain-containing protein [Bacteroidota bacterium]
MNYWLVKSEPSVYGWDQFVKDKKTSWDGIRNYAARNNLRDMQIGDEVFFYHSNEGMEIVGIAKVVKKAYQDSTTDNPNWLAVGLKPLKKLKSPISLTQIKSHKELSTMELVRISRLSVQKVSQEEWAVIMNLSGNE